MNSANESQIRLGEMFDAVKNADSLLILIHNNPDPDAIASAVALRFLLAEKLQVESQIASQGFIGRAENKALVRCLGYPLSQLTDPDIDRTIPIAFIDTQPGAGNNASPAGSTAAIVIDHHPWRAPTSVADYVDIRVDVGATSTILTEYLQTAALEPSPLIATALFYGIKTDTRGLGRNNTSPMDVAAYAYLQSRLDVEILAEIEHAQVPADYFRDFIIAVQAAHIYNGVVIAYLERVKYPDMAAEAADFLSRLEGVQWVICFGLHEGMLNLSVRTDQRQGGAGRLAQAIVGQDGVAGGHGVMAGGQIPLRDRDPTAVVIQLEQRVLQHLEMPPGVAGRPLI
jgi:nanoRNase/pAp phosphatase (c-di-AMP/oligoRNAs hydrolase)